MAQIDHLRSIEHQLSCPHGAEGVDFAAMMHHTNLNMTMTGFHALQLSPSAQLLELGHGNAAHLPLMQQSASLHYTGLEISPLMQQEASRLNHATVKAHCAEFLHYDGQTLPDFKQRFDGILSVNNIYFWTHPSALLTQLHDILKLTGRLSLVYMDEHYLHSLPFVAERFHIYSTTAIERLLQQHGFVAIKTTHHQDQVALKDNNHAITRQFHVTTALVG